MYKILRFCTEGFFLTFDSFCELIFLKKVENDYLLKKIFINRGRNTTSRKHKFFLVQIDDRFCLFTNYKINPKLFNKHDSASKDIIEEENYEETYKNRSNNTSAYRNGLKSPEQVSLANKTEMDSKAENNSESGNITEEGIQTETAFKNRSSSNIKIDKERSTFKEKYLKKKQEVSNNIWQVGNPDKASPKREEGTNNLKDLTSALNNNENGMMKYIHHSKEKKVVQRISYTQNTTGVHQKTYENSTIEEELNLNSAGKRQPRWTYNDPSTIRAMKVITHPNDNNIPNILPQKRDNFSDYEKIEQIQVRKPENKLVFPTGNFFSIMDNMIKEMDSNTKRISLVKKIKPIEEIPSAYKIQISKPQNEVKKVTTITADKNISYSRNASQNITGKVGNGTTQGTQGRNFNYLNGGTPNGGASQKKEIPIAGRRMAGIERRAATYRRVGRSHDIAPTRKFGGTETYRVDRVSVNKTTNQQNSANNKTTTNNTTQANPLTIQPFGSSTVGSNYAGFNASQTNGNYSYRFSKTTDLGANSGKNIVTRDRYY